MREFLEHTRGFLLFSTASSHVGDEHLQAAHRKEGHGCTFHALSTTYSARVRPPTRRRCATRAGRRRAIQSRWPRSSCRHEVHRNLCQIVSIGSRTYRYLPKRWGTTEWEKEVNPVLHSKPRCSGLGVLGRKLVCASIACAWNVNDAEPTTRNKHTNTHVSVAGRFRTRVFFDIPVRKPLRACNALCSILAQLVCISGRCADRECSSGIQGRTKGTSNRRMQSEHVCEHPTYYGAFGNDSMCRVWMLLP